MFWFWFCVCVCVWFWILHFEPLHQPFYCDGSFLR
jgi:hypothetical protein